MEADPSVNNRKFNTANPAKDGVIVGADRPFGPIKLGEPAHRGQNWLLVTLERLLTIENVDLKEALNESADMVASALRADKVDVFLYEAGIKALVAMGISHTPVGRLQIELGLNRLYLENGGRTVLTYQTQQPFLTGHAEKDPDQLLGVIEGLGLHSIISVPLYVKGELRGVLEATALAPDAFSEYDLRFLEAVAGWVSTILHRTELTQQIVQEATAEVRQTTAEELITIIAHDLRNYFTPLKGRLALLRRRAAQEGRSHDLEDLDSIDTILSRLNGMTGDLLDVNRLKHASFTLNKRPLELVGLLKEVAATFDYPGRPVIVKALPPIYLEADAERLCQVIENLLANALEYSQSEAPVEIIASLVEDKNGRQARVAVIDRGPGIDPQILSQLFKPYVRSDRSHGVGLGLYLIKEIVQAHGGTISVETVPGGGTNFSLFLPGIANLEP